MVPLRTIVAALRPGLDAAFVVVMHRPAHGQSQLTELLARWASVPVTNAIDGERLLPGHVYVVPPGEHQVSIEQHRIHLVSAPRVNFHRPAADPLFSSAAKAYASGAVGVVLSGMGRNGTAGLVDIKRAGGQALVQLPAEAEHPSMPLSALGVVEPDLCAPAADIALHLCLLLRRDRQDSTEDHSPRSGMNGF
jgi:two-component system chemotaxis response regulator CheB